MQKMLSVLQRHLSRLWSRACVNRLDSTAACQRVDVSLMAGETKAGMEYLEPYGFTGIAHAGAEGVALFLSGDRSHGIVINIADRRYRLKDLQTGEVAIYTDEGDSIVLKRGKVTEVTTDTLILHAKNKVVLDTPRVETSGEITAEKSIVSQSEIQDRVGSLSSVRDQYNRHTHPGDSGGTTGQPYQRMTK